jgi:hypothetical protein
MKINALVLKYAKMLDEFGYDLKKIKYRYDVVKRWNHING